MCTFRGANGVSGKLAWLEQRGITAHSVTGMWVQMVVCLSMCPRTDKRPIQCSPLSAQSPLSWLQHPPTILYKISGVENGWMEANMHFRLTEDSKLNYVWMITGMFGAP